MKIWPDCIPCIIKGAMGAARLAMDERGVGDFMRALINGPYLKKNVWETTPPELMMKIWCLIYDMSGCEDPFLDLKNKQNEVALSLYPLVKQYINDSDNLIDTALRFAVAGNTIDIMIGSDRKPDKEMLFELQKYPVNKQHLKAFIERLEKSQTIVYFGDNCGEIVFDRLFIETILGQYEKKIVYVVRTKPALNDVTISDAIVSGIDKVVPVRENGNPHPFAGTDMADVSSDIQKLVDEADLIISKGGGNYDSLTEFDPLKGKISFLMQAKCYPYSRLHEQPNGSLIIFNW